MAEEIHRRQKRVIECPPGRNEGRWMQHSPAAESGGEGGGAAGVVVVVRKCTSVRNLILRLWQQTL